MNSYIYDTDYVAIIDEPIERFCCIQNFKFMRKLTITHCEIDIFNLSLPESILGLEITYCNMNKFIPKNIPKNLDYLNLSSNKLIDIPQCLYKLSNSLDMIDIILYDNPFWFLNTGIGAGTWREIDLAYKLDLLSENRMRNILLELRYKALMIDYHALYTLVNRAINLSYSK